MKFNLWRAIETEDRYVQDMKLGEIALENGELSIDVENQEIREILEDFFSQPRKVLRGDPAGRINISNEVILEPGTEEYLIDSIPILLEEYKILAKIK